MSTGKDPGNIHVGFALMMTLDVALGERREEVNHGVVLAVDSLDYGARRNLRI